MFGAIADLGLRLHDISSWLSMGDSVGMASVLPYLCPFSISRFSGAPDPLDTQYGAHVDIDVAPSGRVNRPS